MTNSKSKKQFHNKPVLKKFIVKKYIYATSAKHALKLEKNHPPDDVWVDEDWRKNYEAIEISNIIGFRK